MKNRKLMALGMVAAMTGSLAACGGSSSSSTTTAAATTAAATTAAATEAATTAAAAETTAAAAEASGDAEIGADTQAIIDRGVLRVGVKNAVQGFSFQDTVTGEYEGLEDDLARKIAEDLGCKDGVEFTTVTAATRTELLDSGDIDCVIATFTISDERKKSWDFTTPYYTDHNAVLVQKSSGITDIKDLISKKIGVSSGSNSAKALVQELVDEGLVDGSKFDKDTFDPATWTEGVTFQQYDDYPSISTALTAGEVDGFTVDKSILAIYKTDDRDFLPTEFAAQDYGIATKKGSDFSKYTEAEVQKYLADGTIAGWISQYGLG